MARARERARIKAGTTLGGSGETVRLRFEGAEELLAAIQAMGDAITADVLAEAAMAGAVVIKDAANSLAPGPNIQAEMEERTPKYARAQVGPDKEHFYYLYFETGAMPHEIAASQSKVIAASPEAVFANVKNPADHPGIMARPFLRPALDAKEDAAFEAMRSEFEAAVDRRLKQ